MKRNFLLPAKVLTQHSVLLGKTGAGKSSVMRYIAEHLLSAGKRVVIIDPKGDWWGLKASADGKGAGFPVILFGDFKEGSVTDVPIDEHSGKHLAELITSGNRPCVIGFRGWMPGKMTKFWIDFASTLFNSLKGELFLIGDEFHNFAPKGKILSPEAGLCLHWSNRLLSEARGLGLTCIIGSQRPQKVHNDTLTGCETLFAMRVVHKSDRGAVKDWVDGNGDPKQGTEILNSLAGMQRGEAWVWSPEIDFGPQRVAFPMFETYDSFAPPKLTDSFNRKNWADVNLDTVREKLANVIKVAEANDPVKLRSENAKLKAVIHGMEVAAKRTSVAEAKPLPAEKVFVVRDEDMDTVRNAVVHCENMTAILQEKLKSVWDLRDKLQLIHSGMKSFKTSSPISRITAGVAPTANRPKSESVMWDKKTIQTHVGSASLGISPVAQRILNALAELELLKVYQPVREMVALMAHYTNLASTGFVKAIGELRTAGYVHYPNAQTMALTELGRSKAIYPEAPGSSEEIQMWICALLGGKASEILRPLIDAYPNAVDRMEVAQAAGYTNLASTGFVKVIGRLRSLGFIDYPDTKTMVANKVLFLDT